MKNYLFLLLSILFCVSCQNTEKPSSYDVVILNGRVMDPETNFDGIRNVGIVGDKIVTITEATITGKETIDATGHIVTAGFIDTQNHGHGLRWNAKIGLRDGVTTPLDLEAGNLTGTRNSRGSS